jgi:DedD protein
MQAGNAQALKSTLEAQGLPVYIESRVHVGPFRDRKEAERMRQKLQEMGVSTVLVTQ